jgi:hypothetical protein
MTANDVVANGVALLDANGPADWARQINLKRLNIHDPYNCVLGQLYGLYDTGKWRLALNSLRAGECGCCNSVVAADLTPQCREAIARRQDARVVQPAEAEAELVGA